jgi:hypothetical protein
MTTILQFSALLLTMLAVSCPIIVSCQLKRRDKVKTAVIFIDRKDQNAGIFFCILKFFLCEELHQWDITKLGKDIFFISSLLTDYKFGILLQVLFGTVNTAFEYQKKINLLEVSGLVCKQIQMLMQHTKQNCAARPPTTTQKNYSY